MTGIYGLSVCLSVCLYVCLPVCQPGFDDRGVFTLETNINVGDDLGPIIS